MPFLDLYATTHATTCLRTCLLLAYTHHHLQHSSPKAQGLAWGLPLSNCLGMRLSQWQLCSVHPSSFLSPPEPAPLGMTPCTLCEPDRHQFGGLISRICRLRIARGKTVPKYIGEPTEIRDQLSNTDQGISDRTFIFRPRLDKTVVATAVFIKRPLWS